MEQNHGPWMMRFKLDGTKLSCYLPTEEMHSYIFPKIGYHIMSELVKGVRVAVDDVDSHKTYYMQLRKYEDCYYLTKGWTNLREAKNLKPGDEIGICWDGSSRRFKFHLLNRASLI